MFKQYLSSVWYEVETPYQYHDPLPVPRPLTSTTTPHQYHDPLPVPQPLTSTMTPYQYYDRYM